MSRVSSAKPSRTIPISLSIADLPLTVSPEHMFSVAKTAGFDSVEVVLGMRFRNPREQLKNVSNKYALPIVSFHLPLSIGKLFVSLEESFQVARDHDAVIVAHPLKKYELDDPVQQHYLSNLQKLAKRFRTRVLIENMSPKSSLPIYCTFSKSTASTQDLMLLEKISTQYGFGMTLDTSHLQDATFHRSAVVTKVFHAIGNIHLSDFAKDKQHLGLGEGDLAVKECIEFLIQKKYRGLLTLELSPRLFISQGNYVADVKQSLDLVKSYMQKKAA